MKKYIVNLFVVGLLMTFLTVPNVKAEAIINGGFEDGLSSWETRVQGNTDGTEMASVTSFGDDIINDGTIAYSEVPKYGSKMAKLEGNGSSMLWQDFIKSGKMNISFWWNWHAFDWPPESGPDYFIVYIDDAVLFERGIDGLVHGGNGSEGWLYFSDTVLLAPGNHHTLKFFNANSEPFLGAADSFFTIYIDGVSVSHVPEPTTMLLLGLGLMGLVGVRRKFKE